MSEKIFSKDFWFSLRKETRVNGNNGSLRCTWWCEDALKEQEVSDIFSEKVVYVEDRQIIQYVTSRINHHWLEAEHDGKRFIADGTAGQFDSDFPDGYYGTLDQASEKLIKIYSKKT